MPGCADPSGGLDFAAEDFQLDPWPLYDWHLAHRPVAWSEPLKCFFVFGHGNVKRALTSAEFTAYHPFRRSRAAFGPSTLDSEGPTHRRLRGALAGSFKPGRVAGYADEVVLPAVRTLLDERLGGRPDWVDEVAWRLPTRVACRLLGLPETDEDDLYAMMRPMILFVDHAGTGFAEVVECRNRLRAYLRDRIVTGGVDRQAMLRMMADDDTLAEPEVVDNAILLLAAATETTCSAIVNLFARVAGQPGLFRAVRADPSTVPAVVAETLRHEPPLHVTLRYAAADVEMAGVRMPAGSPVQVCLASANRDPAVYPDPHRWDAGRPRPTPLTFGLGRHHCLGMGLATLELETVLRECTERLDALWTVSAEHPTPRGRTFRSVPGLRLGARAAA
jgi:cytochrome P450